MKLQLSHTAFWDVDFDKLNQSEHADFIIARVFQYGILSDLRVILKNYSGEEIKHAFKTQRGIDQRTIDLARVLGFIEE